MSYNTSKLNVDGLIFSVNDVLVDVSRSYRQVVSRTVQLYLERCIGLAASNEPLLTTDEVALLKQVGSFTNYLDLAVAFITYFIELLPAVPSPTFPSKYHVPAIIAYLQLAGGRLQIGIDHLRREKDIGQLAREVAEAGGGPDAADLVLPRMNRHLLVEGGDITRTNLIGRIFQELYLGAKLFEQIYEQPAVIVQVNAYLEQGPLLIDPEVLAELSGRIPLGIVANVWRVEVENTLKTHKVEQHFQSVISLDEIHKAKAQPPPSPWALLEAARLLNPTPAHCAYVGISLADIEAAQAANGTVPFAAIGCLFGANDKEILRQDFERLKANVILGHPNHLRELILD
jgi:phosphoglycolate phosphatase-like HAD superfamily hydrolase